MRVALTILLLVACLARGAAPSIWAIPMASAPRQTNYVVGIAWDAPADGPWGYGFAAYWGPVKGVHTNRVDVGPWLTTTLTLPSGRRSYIVVRSYYEGGPPAESPESVEVFYPGQRIDVFNGTNLQQALNLRGPWTVAPSRLVLTNETAPAALFLRSPNHINHTNYDWFGN